MFAWGDRRLSMLYSLKDGCQDLSRSFASATNVGHRLDSTSQRWKTTIYRNNRIVRVIELKKLPPAVQPTFVFAGKNADPERVTKYTRDKNVLSVTNVPDHVSAGVTLGIGVENNRPKVLLNLTGSEAERMSWDPKILKISKTIK